MEICQHCKNEIPEDSKFCQFCGKKIENTAIIKQKFCTKCGQEVPDAAKFCVYCGTKAGVSVTLPPATELSSQTGVKPPAASPQASTPPVSTPTFSATTPPETPVAPLSAAAPPSSAPQYTPATQPILAPQGQAPANPFMMQQEPLMPNGKMNGGTKKTKSAKKWLIPLIAVLALALVAAGIFLIPPLVRNAKLRKDPSQRLINSIEAMGEEEIMDISIALDLSGLLSEGPDYEKQVAVAEVFKNVELRIQAEKKEDESSMRFAAEYKNSPMLSLDMHSSFDKITLLSSELLPQGINLDTKLNPDTVQSIDYEKYLDIIRDTEAPSYKAFANNFENYEKIFKDWLSPQIVENGNKTVQIMEGDKARSVEVEEFCLELDEESSLRLMQLLISEIKTDTKFFDWLEDRVNLLYKELSEDPALLEQNPEIGEFLPEMLNLVSEVKKSLDDLSDQLDASMENRSGESESGQAMTLKFAFEGLDRLRELRIGPSDDRNNDSPMPEIILRFNDTKALSNAKALKNASQTGPVLNLSNAAFALFSGSSSYGMSAEDMLYMAESMGTSLEELSSTFTLLEEVSGQIQGNMQALPSVNPAIKELMGDLNKAGLTDEEIAQAFEFLFN